MRILAAADKFRGTADASEVVAAIAAGGRSVGARTTEMPMSELLWVPKARSDLLLARSSNMK